MKFITDAHKEHELTEFLKLSPLDRMKIMYAIMSEIITIKAKAEGVSEYEIYKRYLKNNPGHYHEKEKTLELARRIGRDKKLQEFLSQLREEPTEDLPEDLI